MINTEVELSPRQVVIKYLTEHEKLTLPIIDDSKVPPAAEVAPFVNLPVQRIAVTMGNMRKGKHPLLPPAIPENTRHRLSVGVSASRGGKWSVLQRYSFMAPEEADFALQEILGAKRQVQLGLSINNIRGVLTKHAVAGHIKHTDEERKSIHGTIHESRETKRGRAIFWAIVIELLEEQGINRPTNRMVWIDIWKRAEDVNDGVTLVIERMAEGQRLQSSIQQLLERELDSLWGHVQQKFLSGADMDGKKLNGLKEVIDRIDSMSLTLEEKERLFRCIFWEEKGAKAYAGFFGVPKEKLWQNLKDLIDVDMDQLHARYDSLLPVEEKN